MTDNCRNFLYLSDYFLLFSFEFISANFLLLLVLRSPQATRNILVGFMAAHSLLHFMFAAELLRLLANHAESKLFFLRVPFCLPTRKVIKTLIAYFHAFFESRTATAKAKSQNKHKNQ